MLSAISSVNNHGDGDIDSVIRIDGDYDFGKLRIGKELGASC